MNTHIESVVQASDAPLLISKSPDQWLFTLNRPKKRNALSPELVEALIQGMSDARQEQVALIVFKGQGSNFSAGFDLSDYELISSGDLLLRMVRIETMLQQIAAYPGLTLALAHGANFGAGVDLIAACNRRYATREASFRMPGLTFGLVLGTRRFREIVGSSAALSILGCARAFDANEALDIGFLHGTAQPDFWESLMSDILLQATTLDHTTRKSLHSILACRQSNDDMAELVYSASRGDLKARIRAYRNRG